MQKVNFVAQKIDNTTLKINEIVVLTFFLFNKNGKIRFFEKNYLLINISSKIVLKIFFLIIQNFNVSL